jgi:hypothetical protein
MLRPYQLESSVLGFVLSLIFVSNSFDSNVFAAGVIASGDEWLLTNEAFTANTAAAQAYAENIAAHAGGNNYLIYSNSAIVAYGSSFQSFLSGKGITVTATTAPPFSDALLAPYDAVFLAGQLGSGAANAAILSNYVNNGGTVYLSLGATDSAAAEAGWWNPLLNQWGLQAGSEYFTDRFTANLPVKTSSHPLMNNVPMIRWGYGQEITAVNTPGSSSIVFTGEFGGATGDRGAIGISVAVPEPTSLVCMIPIAMVGIVIRRGRPGR